MDHIKIINQPTEHNNESMELNKPKFILSAKKLFLTWPQCELDPAEVLLQVEKIGAAFNLTDYFIVKEQGEDGNNPHIHAYLSFNKKYYTKNPNRWDLVNGDKVYHGDYEAARSEPNSLNYLAKNLTDEDRKEKLPTKFIISDRLELLLNNEGKVLKYDEAVMALAKQGRIDEAMAMYEKRYPAKYILIHDKLRASLRSLALQSLGLAAPKFKLSDFIYSPWIKNIIETIKNKKTVVLYGPSGIGKTQFILTLLTEILGLTPLVINNFDALRNYKEHIHTAIVYDDCAGWDTKSIEEVVKLVDSETPTTHSIKHSSVNIPVPTPKVVIGNPPIPAKFFGIKAFEHPVGRRVVIFILNEDSPKLFNIDPQIGSAKRYKPNHIIIGPSNERARTPLTKELLDPTKDEKRL